MAAKDGILWKWTNYYNGWQPRWFVLRDGILSYYQSEDEVNVRCKGSIKLEACSVQCHSTDLTRFEVAAPRSCRLFLKAATPRERQLWYLTLQSEIQRWKLQPNTSTSSDQHTTTRSRSASIGSNSPSIDSVDASFLHDVKCKRSEIRLYGDLLETKLETLKQLVSNASSEPITDERFSETVQMIAPTCSTLVAALDELAQLVELAQAKLGGPKSPSPSLSVEPFSDSAVTSNSANLDQDHNHSNEQPASNHKHHDVQARVETKPKLKTALRIACDLLSSLLSNSQTELSTDAFLRLCALLLGVLESLRVTFPNLEPVVIDLDSNLRQLRSRFECDRSQFSTLNALLSGETESDPQSQCSSALLWLKRSFEFARIFLELVMLDTQHDVSGAATKAYRAGLQVYHGSVLRESFNTLTQSGLPNWPQIVRACVYDVSQSEAAPDGDLEQVANADISELTPALRRLTDSLNSLLKRHNVDLNSMI